MNGSGNSTFKLKLVERYFKLFLDTQPFFPAETGISFFTDGYWFQNNDDFPSCEVDESLTFYWIFCKVISKALVCKVEHLHCLPCPFEPPHQVSFKFLLTFQWSRTITFNHLSRPAITGVISALIDSPACLLSYSVIGGETESTLEMRSDI